MSHDRGPTGEHGRPASGEWWLPDAVYVVGYALSLVTAAVAAAWLPGAGGSDWRAGGLTLELVLLLFGLSPYLFWHVFPPRFANGLGRFVERRHPTWSVLAAGAACGSLAAVGLIGLEHVPIDDLRWAGLVLFLLAGPLPGIWWLIRRRPGSAHGDYDDGMTTEPDPASHPFQIDLPDLAATEAVGRRLGGLLFPNAVVALVGPLGAGKTHLARAVAEGLGIANPAAVTSPTFTLVHEYPARLPIYHFDAYRLNGPNEFLDLGVNEYYEAGGVCLIEWADKVESALPPERLTIRLTPVDENRRRADVVGIGEKYQALANALASGETAVARSAARDTAGETP